jgi:hypothetical protein
MYLNFEHFSADKTNSNQYANLGWHPTLERMMGVHKSKRNKGPRLALKGQLAGMKVVLFFFFAYAYDMYDDFSMIYGIVAQLCETSPRT